MENESTNIKLQCSRGMGAQKLILAVRGTVTILNHYIYRDKMMGRAVNVSSLAVRLSQVLAFQISSLEQNQLKIEKKSPGGETVTISSG